MQFGILADIHSNLEALTVALNVFEEEGVDQIISLGDVLGYNANPIECLNLLIEKEIHSIKGNHERYIIGEKNETLKEDTRKMIDWTREQLSEELHNHIAEKMPNKMQHECGFLITHGSPRNKDEYLLKLHSFVANLKLMEEKYPTIRVAFHGHTHLPSVMARGHIVQEIHEDMKIMLDPEKAYLINPGSVGQPRDKCPKTSFGIYNNEEFSFRFYRRDYDIKKTQEKVRALGFSERFADRLAKGK